MEILNWLLPVVCVVGGWLAVVIGMRKHWKKRSRQQELAFGSFSPIPPAIAAAEEIIPALNGIYAGTVAAEDAFSRIVTHGSGFRTGCELHGYREGILLARYGAPDIWIARENIITVRWARALAGKVPPGGLLVIHHQLSRGGLVDTGFRADPTNPKDPLVFSPENTSELYDTWIKEFTIMNEERTKNHQEGTL